MTGANSPPGAGRQNAMTHGLNVTTAMAMPARGTVGWLALRTVRNLRKGFNWAWLDTKCRYRRSKIGPLWETINVLVMMSAMTVASSAVIGGSIAGLIGYVGLGISVWSAISALVTEGSLTFIRDREYILSSNFSIDIYISRTVFKSFITFSHHFVLYFIGTALGLVHFGWTSLLAVVGIVLLFLNGYWIVALFALVCTRYRDVEQIVRNLLQLGFFVTPVFWDYRVVASNRAFVVDYNFLFYMLEIV